MAVDLVFGGTPLGGSPVNLVFGAEDVPTAPVDNSFTINALLPGAVGVGIVAQGTTVAISATMQSMVGAGLAHYDARTARPLVNHVESRFQDGVPSKTDTHVRWATGRKLRVDAAVVFQDAVALQTAARMVWQQSLNLRQERGVRFQDALALLVEPTDFRYQQSLPVALSRAAQYQEALRLRALAAAVRFQQGTPVRNRAAVRYQDAVAQFLRVSAFESQALPLALVRGGRYQGAIVPPGGMWVYVTPGGDPCYIPPLGNDVQLVFSETPGGTDLVYVCETHPVTPPSPGGLVVVPIQRVYVVLNSASLRRVDGNVPIHSFGMSLSVDWQSWTWTFSATLPGSELDKVMPGTDGNPVVIEATINGVAYRTLVESITRSRTFGAVSLQVRGRGVNAELDAPYAPVLNFGNATARTAQQLMGDVLSINNVPLPDWSVDWALDDWAVPGGIWTYQGSYIGALNTIVGAAGGYLQPNPSNKTLRALHKYPVAPWDWGSVTPDYELPSAITTVEGLEWADKPLYNRVFVSGVNAGVLGQYTRSGTDGGLVAEMVTDSLITAAAAARQRGRAIIGDTGRQANVSLRLPVLPATGLILPGKFVKYTDEGTDRLGIVRSMNVEVGMPEIMQTISLETHL